MNAWKILLVLSIFQIGCTSAFKRTGYVQPSDTAAATADRTCKVALTYQATISENKKMVGVIEAREPGFGTNCQEAFVLTTFIKDACSLNANVVNLIEESQPDIWSTCYRAKAELIQVSSGNIKSDEKFSPDKIYERSEKGDNLTKQMIYGGFIGGAIGGAAAAASSDSK